MTATPREKGDAAAYRAARARSFGDDPLGYDDARPSYPAELIDDLLEGDAPTVLDVGCGTGKASRLLANRGARVLGVEADERMAAVARGFGLEVEVARFEAWDPKGRRFGLLVAGQSWHWVDPVAGPGKAADVLEDGSRIGLFWNLRRRPAAEVAAVFDDLYARLAPELAATSKAFASSREAGNTEAYLEGLTSTGRFDCGEIRRYTWQFAYDPGQWRALLATQSDHRLLEADRRERLLDEAAATVERLGGTLEVDYVTLALLARRVA